MSTLQTIFDKIINHLDNQKKKSIEENLCMYRGPNGLKCAIGVLIDDKHYYDDLETLPATHSEVVQCLRLSGNYIEHDNKFTELLQDCQFIHDYYGARAWKEKFKVVAEKFNLIFDDTKLN